MGLPYQEEKTGVESGRLHRFRKTATCAAAKRLVSCDFVSTGSLYQILDSSREARDGVKACTE